MSRFCRHLLHNTMNQSGQLLFGCIVGRRLRGFHRGGAAAGISTSHPLLSSLEQMNGNFDNINNLDDALCSYRRMIRTSPLPPVECFTHLLESVVNLKEYSAALSLHKDFCTSGAPVDEYTMNIVIDCYCSLGRVDYGFSILGSFFKRGCMPNEDTFRPLLRALIRAGEVFRAQELFEKIILEKLCEVIVLHYITLTGLCVVGNTRMAVQLLRFMERVGCEPDLCSYSIILRSFAQVGNMVKARKFYKLMLYKGFKPNALTYNSLIRRFCDSENWDEVMELLNDMSAPSLVTYNIVVNGLCKKRKVKDAEYLLWIMIKNGVNPDVSTYNSFMEGYCLHGKLDKARRVFDSITDKGLLPNICSYYLLIKGYCEAHKMEEAMKIFQEIRGKGLQPKIMIYNAILQGLFRVGRCDEAWKWYHEIEASGCTMDCTTCFIVIHGLCNNKKIEEALNFLHSMEEKKFDTSEHMYNVVIDELCKSGKLDIARDVFDGLSSRGIQPNIDTYIIMIRGYCQAGLLQEMKSWLLNIEDSYLLIRIIYNVTVQELLRRGEMQEAIIYLEEMRKRDVSPDASTLKLILDSNVKGQALLDPMNKFCPDLFHVGVASKQTSC